MRDYPPRYARPAGGRRVRSAFHGTLIGPEDPGYDDARAVYNGMIDRRPRLIARCADTADVIAAVGLARESGVPLAVRGGGHNAAGMGVADDAMVVDLSTRCTRMAGGAYVNMMMDDEGEERVRASYRDNYDRLVEVKRRYDPANLFRFNQNIAP